MLQFERSNLDGTKRSKVADFSTSANIHPLGIALYNSSVIFSDQNLLGLFRYELSGNTAYQILKTVTKPGGLVLHNTSESTGRSLVT